LSVERGAGVFARNCAICHALEGQGGVLGPQLDGVGARGADRLLEDILDPNRNVDRAFRLTLLTLTNGSVVAGLPRGEEGEQLVFSAADGAAQEIRVRKADVSARKETETSLMPAAFGEILKPEELNDLLGFLLTKRPR
jgi:putative heme-binding domain-containing protein